MNSTRKHFLLLFLLIQISLSGFAQSLTSDQLAAKIDKWHIEMPREKVYLHLDKSIYVAGEDLWLKAYVVEGREHKPSYISSVVYVELINENDELIEQLVLNATNGGAPGDIKLSKDLQGGTYRLRAYTQWMRNTDESFQSSIQILSPKEQQPTLSPETALADLQFLPEGGDWVAGLEGKMAFKAVGTNGLGMEVKGKIVDGDGRAVANFESFHKGMGHLMMTPEKGQKYRAIIESQGRQQSYPLPEALPSGFEMSVKPGAMVNSVHITSTPDMNEPVFYLIGQVRGQIAFSMHARLKGNDQTINIPNYKIPGGIMQLTLLDAAGVAHCERLFFIQERKSAQLELSVNKQEFDKREKVELSLKALDPAGKAVKGHFSISVANEYAIWNNNPDYANIKSHLLLSSDLRGVVEDAAYYLSNDEKSNQALDVLLLTQGWRKVSWERIIKEDYPEVEYLIEQGLTVSGNIRNPAGKVVKNGIVNLTAGNIFNVYSAQADESGNFILGGMDFDDTTKIVMQARNAKNKEREIYIRLDSLEAYKIGQWPVSTLGQQGMDDPNMVEYLLKSQQQIEATDIREGEYTFTIDEVDIEARQNEKTVNTSQNALYREADHTVEADDLPMATNIFEAIRGRFPGVKITGGYDDYQVQMRTRTLSSTPGDPLYLIDGTPVDEEAIVGFPIAQVERIDVIQSTRASVFGMRGINGVIAVYSKKDYERTEQDDQLVGIIRPDLTGFSLVRTFYSPAYTPDQPENSLPDLRTTVYWNPIVETDEKGEAKLSFYHSDVTGIFQITALGITENGSPMQMEMQYEVKD